MRPEAEASRRVRPCPSRVRWFVKAARVRRPPEVPGLLSRPDAHAYPRGVVAYPQRVVSWWVRMWYLSRNNGTHTPDGRQHRRRAKKKPQCAGLSQCPREDSNFHGPINFHGRIGPQGPQPRSRRVDALSSVQIVQIAGVAGRIGRGGRGGCCHECCHAVCGLRRRSWRRTVAQRCRRHSPRRGCHRRVKARRRPRA